MNQEHNGQAEPSSPWPAVTFAFLGGGLAVVGVSVQRPTVEFLACGALLVAWYLARTSGGAAAGDQANDDQAASAEDRPAVDHPMAKRSTQLLLLLFAVIVGAVGALRIMRGP